MNRLLAVCVLLVLVFRASPAQHDRPAEADTVDEEVRFGLSAGIEDSPLAELLATEPAPSAPVIELRSRLTEHLEASDGYRNGTYAGSRMKSYQRVRFTPSDHLSAGLLLEKDPGERKFDDFATGYLALRRIGPFRTVLLGDYIVESALGLALWRGADVGKGEDIAGAVVRKERGIVPHFSSDENTYFRGAALGMQFGGWSVNLFTSRRGVDASVNALGEATGIYAAGYFRTSGEEAKRGALGERLYGATAHVQDPRGNTFGACLYRSLYARELSLDAGARFSGKRAAAASCDYHWRSGPWDLFGEWGIANGSPGGNSCARLKAAQGVDLVAALRYYPYRFVSLHGNGFGEHAGMSDEKGVYTGIRLASARRWSVAGYVDLFRFPGGVPSQRFAGGGSDRFLQLEFQPAARCAVALRYASKVTLQDLLVRDGAGLFATQQASSSRRSLRLNIDYRTFGGVHVRGRWERTMLSADSSGSAGHGMLVLAELTAPSAAQFWWNARITIFRTTSYEARLSAYERDLEGATSMPVLYGEGLRWSCVIRYAFSKAFVCSVKYTEEVRDDVKRIGTGPDRLPGNELGTAGVQIDLAL